MARLYAIKYIEHGFFRNVFCVNTIKFNIQPIVPMNMRMGPMNRYKYVCIDFSITDKSINEVMAILSFFLHKMSKRLVLIVYYVKQIFYRLC